MSHVSPKSAEDEMWQEHFTFSQNITALRSWETVKLWQDTTESHQTLFN